MNDRLHAESCLKELLSRIPEACEALRRIPHAVGFLTRALGEPTHIWDTDNTSDITTKLLCSGLQLELEALQEQLSSIEEKYQVARAAERGWKPMLQARTSVVFRNDASDIATMPIDLVRLIAAKGNFDGEVVAKQSTIAFKNGRKVVAEVPKTLFVCLEKILETSAWNTRKT
ncbi:hypothetical protein ACFL59_08315 [Planctomycetota bacterium]